MLTTSSQPFECIRLVILHGTMVILTSTSLEMRSGWSDPAARPIIATRKLDTIL
jgi:hypothetical protein